MWVEVAGGIGSERAWWERETEELSTQAKDKVAVAADDLRATRAAIRHATLLA